MDMWPLPDVLPHWSDIFEYWGLAAHGDNVPFAS